MKRISKYQSLSSRAAVIAPWVEVTELFIAARPLIVKGRKPDPEGDAKRAERLKDTHTCQYCGGAWLVVQAASDYGPRKGANVIAHHGYSRPQQGSGVQTASCPGARRLPYEIDCNGLPEWIEDQFVAANNHKVEADHYASRPRTVPREIEKRTNAKTLEVTRYVVIRSRYGPTRHEKADEFGGNLLATRDVDSDYEHRRNVLQIEHEQRERLHRAEWLRLTKRLQAWTMSNNGWRGRVGE